MNAVLGLKEFKKIQLVRVNVLIHTETVNGFRHTPISVSEKLSLVTQADIVQF